MLKGPEAIQIHLHGASFVMTALNNNPNFIAFLEI